MSSTCLSALTLILTSNLMVNAPYTDHYLPPPSATKYPTNCSIKNSSIDDKFPQSGQTHSKNLFTRRSITSLDSKPRQLYSYSDCGYKITGWQRGAAREGIVHNNRGVMGNNGGQWRLGPIWAKVDWDWSGQLGTVYLW